MARYDLHPSPGGSDYVVDVQADLLSTLNTRIVVPLMLTGSAPTPARRLNPTFEINGESYVLVTQFMAAVPRAELSAPVASLAAHDGEIMAAIDMALTGF